MKASVAVTVALFTLLLPACGGDVVVDDPPKGSDGQGGNGGTSSQSSSSTQSGSSSPDVAASSTGSGGAPQCGCQDICPGFVACTGCTGCPCESFSDAVRTCLCGAGNECGTVEECLPDDFLCPL